MITEKMLMWGTISRTHGVKGQLIVDLEQTLTNEIENTELVLLELEGLPVPFFLDPKQSKFRNHRQLLIKFDTVNSIEEAEKLLHVAVYLPDRFIPEAEKNEFQSDFQDYELIDANNQKIGIIKKIIDNPGNQLIQITDNAGKEHLIPLVDEWIQELDDVNKKIRMELPDGMLDL